MQNSFVAPTDAALIRPRSCGRPCFATGYFRFAPIAHILRTIQRDGRDAVGLRSTLAAAFGGALRAVHIPKTERGSFPTKPSLPKNCCARFSAYGGRLALLGTLPRVRGARRALPALAVALTNCRALSVKPRCEDKRIFRGRSNGLVSRSRNEAGRARVGGGRGATMPRPLLDYVKSGRSFAASEEAVLPLPDAHPVSSEPAKRFCISGYLKFQISNLISGRGPRSPVGWAGC